MQDDPQKKKHHFFCGAPRIFKNEFYTYTLGEQWQIKLKQLEPGHYTF